jgi:hypothetical protein
MFSSSVYSGLGDVENVEITLFETSVILSVDSTRHPGKVEFSLDVQCKKCGVYS